MTIIFGILLVVIIIYCGIAGALYLYEAKTDHNFFRAMGNEKKGCIYLAICTIALIVEILLII